MKQNKLIIYLGLMSVIVLAMLNFTMFSQEQMYSLEQYRQAKVDYAEGNYTENNQVMVFDNSTVKFSTNSNVEIDNGLIIADKEVYHVVNGNKELINIDANLNFDNIYSKYLIYYYTFYMSPLMILVYIVFAIAKSIVGIALMYTTYRIILHKVKRDDVYIKESKFKDYKLSIALTLVLTNVVYAYSSFFIGYKLPIMVYVVMIVVSYIIVLKSLKKIKR